MASRSIRKIRPSCQRRFVAFRSPWLMRKSCSDLNNEMIAHATSPSGFSSGDKRLSRSTPGTVLCDEKGAPAQGPDALLDQGQRTRRSDAVEPETMSLAPRVPSPAGPPETGERMTQILQVVALDDQRPVAQPQPNHRTGPPVLEQNPTAHRDVGRRQDRLQKIKFSAQRSGKTQPTAGDCEQRAIAQCLAQEFAQAPVTHTSKHTSKRTIERVRIAKARSAAGHVGIEQTLPAGVPGNRKLRQQDSKVRGGLLVVQRLARGDRTNRVAIDYKQFFATPHEVAEMQILLHQTRCVQTAKRTKGGTEHIEHVTATSRRCGKWPPHVRQTLGSVNKCGDQNVPAVRQCSRQQHLRGRHTGLVQGVDSALFLRPVPRAATRHEELDQHMPIVPQPVTDDPLAGQHAQQAMNPYRRTVGQHDRERRRRRAPGLAQTRRVEHVPPQIVHG